MNCEKADRSLVIFLSKKNKLFLRCYFLQEEKLFKEDADYHYLLSKTVCGMSSLSEDANLWSRRQGPRSDRVNWNSFHTLREQTIARQTNDNKAWKKKKKKSDDEKELEVISEKAEYIREEQQYSRYFSTPE